MANNEDHAQDSNELADSTSRDTVRLVSRRRVLVGLASLFAVASTSVLGVGLKSRRSRPKLSVAIAGPFPSNQFLAINAPPSEFVAPRLILLAKDDRNAEHVSVVFQFQGEENPSRRIRLKVSLHDADGDVLGTASALCEDRRLAAPQRVGILVERPSPDCCANFQIPVSDKIEHPIAQVSLLFEDV